MADRFPGGVISKTPPEVVAPVDGEGGSASGVWTLDEVLGYQKAGSWPRLTLPRELYAWGANSNGQVGDGTTTASSSPVQIGALTNWAHVAAATVSVAVKTDGTMWSWGANSQGQLGDGTTYARSSPVQIGALTNWYLVATNSTLCLAVKTDGTMWSWGANSQGQLGLGDAINTSSPSQIGALTSWAKVAAGPYNGTAIKTDGTLWSWGAGSRGAVGDLTNYVYRSSPVQIGALSNWYTVSRGERHALATKTDGTLWAWGSAVSGQLGDNTRLGGDKSSPVQIGALTNWSTAGLMAGSSNTSVAVKTDGTLWLWGYNGSGQVGDNTITDRSSPVQVGALTSWQQASAGASVTLAVKTDGTLWSWGAGTGSLGQNSAVSTSSPVQIGSLTNWFSVSGGGGHSIAITRG
jgi:alpha-tubulin suppressor-like RCC1 family protein